MEVAFCRMLSAHVNIYFLMKRNPHLILLGMRAFAVEMIGRMFAVQHFVHGFNLYNRTLFGREYSKSSGLTGMFKGGIFIS